MRARHKDAKGKQYSYEDHYEDDDYMNSYDDSYTPSMESHLAGPMKQGFQFSIANEIPEDDNDLLNDCLDQIDDFLDGQIQYDEDTVVEFLRQNDYNVEEAIDFIMDNGACVDTPSPEPLPKIIQTKAPVVKSLYTPPSNTLASVIGKSTKGPEKPKPVVQNVYTIEEDLMKDAKRFGFNTLSPDDYVKKMQDEGKTRQQQHQSSSPFSIDFPISISELHDEPTPKGTQSKPITPKPSIEKSPRSPIENQFDTQTTKSPPCLIEGKDMITVVIAGHVDHGKSTITGHLMYQLNMVSDRDLRRVTREAKDYGKQSFNYAFIMDQNPEEREHGVTIDLGVTHFQTKTKNVTLLDAPGHRDFISAMICGGQQADCGVLVVSAQKGEFEAGISEAGITKEHLLILAGSGIQSLIILINKMDTWNYDKKRYDEIIKTLIPYLKHLGFKKQNVVFIPVSGLEGVNLLSIDKTKCSWYEGRSFIEELDEITPVPPMEDLQNTNDVVMMITDVYHGDFLGDCIAARIVRGFIDLAAQKPLMVLPSKLPLRIRNLLINEMKTSIATVNTNIVLSVIDTNTQLISYTTVSYYNMNRKGNLITTCKAPILPTNRFIAQVFVNDVINKPVMKGLTVVLHLASSSTVGVVQHMLALVDSEGKVLQNKPKIVRGGQWVSVEFALQHEVYVAPVTKIPLLGRFIMRYDGLTLGIGRITELKPSKFHKMYDCLFS